MVKAMLRITVVVAALVVSVSVDNTDVCRALWQTILT